MAEANMLQVIVMALILGFAIILVGEKNVRVVNAFNDLNEIFMKCMEMILKLSPYRLYSACCVRLSQPMVRQSSVLWSMVLLGSYISATLCMLLLYIL